MGQMDEAGFANAIAEYKKTGGDQIAKELAEPYGGSQ
jgi:hypothetical protein